MLFAILAFSIPACSLFPTLTVNGTPVANGNGTSNATELGKWKAVAPGIDLRYEDWKSPNDNEDVVTILRLDPHKINFSVHYQPDNPLTASQWLTKEKANVVINGGYFDQQNNAEGMVIIKGQRYGTNYTNFGGMFSVNPQGTVDLRFMQQRPFDPNAEQLEYAAQSQPMLVTPGGKRTSFEANSNTSPRSIVARDTRGNILFIASPHYALTLDDIADHLVQSDLSIDSALSLDGGSSTALYARGTTDQQVSIDAGHGAIPIIIAAKEK